MLTINLLPDGRRLGRRRAIQARYNERHKAERAVYRKVNQPRYTKYYRAWRIEKLYNTTVEEVARMLDAQGGHCAVCPRTEGLHIDHDHATGRVRGLLCGNHNRALGLADDNIAVLRGLASYLESK